MSRRGPYKQYECNASIAVPKQTVHNRRKRRILDVDGQRNQDENEVHDCVPEVEFELDLIGVIKIIIIPEVTIAIRKGKCCLEIKGIRDIVQNCKNRWLV